MTNLQILQSVFYIIGTIVGLLTIFGTFIAWRKKSFAGIRKMAKTFNLFMTKTLPSVLQGLENNNIVADGTLINWIAISSGDDYSIESPKHLSEIGKKLFEKSGINIIIDNNLNDLLRKLRKQKLENLLDVENKSFYVLMEALKEYDKHGDSIKNYLYKYPEEDIYRIVFVGSLYLRDKYLEKHSELSK